MKLSLPSDIKIKNDECLDVFMGGRLRLIQFRNGYKFSSDSVIICEFANVREGNVIVDLGTGCGIIPLILHLMKPVSHIIGLEIQKDLADQANRNVIINGCSDRISIIKGDIRFAPLKEKSADIVICNPPYRPAKSGRISIDPRRAIAKHEILVTIDDVLGAATKILRKKGKLVLIYPAFRLGDVMARLKHFSLEPKRLQIVYPDNQSAGNLVIIESCSGGNPGLEILSPYYGQGTILGVGK